MGVQGLATRLRSLALPGVGAAVALGLGYWGYGKFYRDPMKAAETRRTEMVRSERYVEEQLGDLGGVRPRLREIAATTLGATEERVAHHFRSLLYDMATSAGLYDVTVSEGRTAGVANPAGQTRLQGFQRSELRVSHFAVMTGEVRATGSLESVARVLALARRQPWVHRVVSFGVTPLGDDRQHFDVRVSLATIFLPDVPPPADAAFAVTPLERGSELAWQPIVARNVFRLPPPVQVAVTQAAPPPPPPPPPPPETPPPPYHQWKVAGVMEGTAGIEVVMLDTSSGRSQILSPGGLILDARLERAGGEEAVFVINEQSFLVRLGQTLAQRRRVEPPRADGGDAE
ncbi:MAG: hypothetical protein KDA05_10855 [Phycisphaerales bacterium]|nr:hypothetical protein [Phycisphaerales bacterium]